jgi:hypothetical protein
MPRKEPSKQAAFVMSGQLVGFRVLPKVTVWEEDYTIDKSEVCESKILRAPSVSSVPLW